MSIEETDLTNGSRKRVKRTCDLCGEVKDIKFCDIMRCRKRKNTTNDYCPKCSSIVYMSGDNNPSKLNKNRKKISEATKGKSKKFKDGKNLRILGRKVNTAGYIMVYSEKEKKYILEHRNIVENSLKIKLNKNDVVHHIDGNKKNNEENNLEVMSKAEHDNLHQNLANVAYDLISKGIIRFNKKSKEYYVSPIIEENSMPISLGFDDVAITQDKNKCLSRLHVDISSEVIRGVNLNVPMIASNMSTVCDSSFCITLYKLGSLGVMHRASSIDLIEAEVKKISKECEWTAASIGVGDGQFDMARKLIKSGANIIFIDIAHGYSDQVLDLGKSIKKKFPHVKIVIGNTVNTNMLYESYEFADAIKVGIAQGFACETKNTAGCTEKQFSAVNKFKHISKEFNIPIISDGGIREPADLTKAIGAGANSIMAGKIFAACPESAAEVIQINNKDKKIYAGMASRYVQDRWKGGLKDGTCPEGGVRYLDVGESAEDLIKRYGGALKSGITYAGADNIEEFQKKVKFVRIK